MLVNVGAGPPRGNGAGLQEDYEEMRRTGHIHRSPLTDFTDSTNRLP